MTYDKESFLAGLQLGRRLKAIEARRKLVPVEKHKWLLTEYKRPILAEDGNELKPEGGA